MASPASSKKQIIESIKDKKNILVAVSSSPSVDELSAALGLTIFLNKLDKHVTAIASGTIPSALGFLDPEKTFEATADSLRDFIIALDKEKADHLRYKLDGDVVKIFITPYRTTITQKDLEFSQGDYNVELVLALNVAESGDLDKALSAHGKILHDATVVTISTGNTKGSLGTIEWHEDEVSGVSEMVAELIQELKTAKVGIDEQIATALLTGIVASTERFGNDLTSSKVMTVSAELMALGANQQLIATQLQQETDVVTSKAERIDMLPKQSDATPVQPEEPEEVEEKNDPTRLTINRGDAVDSKTEPSSDLSNDDAHAEVTDHQYRGTLDEVAKQVQEQSQRHAARAAEAQLSDIEEVAEVPFPEISEGGLPLVQSDITHELERATEQITTNTSLVGAQQVATLETSSDYPMVGGTLNATTAAAAEQKREEQLRNQNRTILTHNSGPLGVQPVRVLEAPMNAAMAAQADEQPLVDIFAAPSSPMPAPSSDVVTDIPMQSTEVSMSAQQSALAEVNTVFDASVQPVVPPLQPRVGMPTLADIEASSTSGLPPMPNFASLPQLPPMPTSVDPNGLPPLPTAQPQEFNPAQFQIPPQE